MIVFEKLQPVKEMSTKLVVYYPYFLKNYELIAIDLIKQQALDDDQKEIRHINFTGNLVRDTIANTTMFFIINLDFSQGPVK